MARTFPGGANTDNLAATISAYDSGPWTVFAWHTTASGTGGTNGRILHVGTGTSGQLFYWSGETTIGIEQGFASQQNQAAFFSHGGHSDWRFKVFGYDGSTLAPDDDAGTTHDEAFGYVGDLSTSMTQVDVAPGLAGVGARTTGHTDLRIGNRQNGLNRCWNGKLFCVGMVPYMMDLATAEELRLGNMAVLLDFAAPIFLFGLEGTDLVSAEQYDAGYGPDLTLTATGSGTDTDPITLEWSGGTVTDQGVSGAITPTGALTTQEVQVFYQDVGDGAITPAGALTADFILGNHTPTIVDIEGTSSNTVTKPAGGTTGDMYLIFSYHETVGDPGSTCSGFIKLDGSHQGFNYSGSSHMYITSWYRVHDGTEGATFTVTNAGDVMCVLIRGADTSLVPSFGTHSETSTTGNSIVANGVTTAEDASLGFIHAVQLHGGNPDFSATGWTQVHKSGNESSILSRELTTAGVQSNATVGFTGTPSWSMSQMFAFLPVVAEEEEAVPYKPPTDIARRAAITHQRHLHRALTAQHVVTYFPGAVIHALELSGAIAPAGSLDVVVNKALAGTVTPAGVITPSFESGSSTILYGDLLKQTNKPLAGAALTPAGSLDTQVIEQLTGALTPAGAITKLISRTFTPANITPTGALTTETILSGVSGASPVIGLATRTAVTHQRPHHRALTAQPARTWGPFLYELSLSGALTPAGALDAVLNRDLAGALTPTGQLDQLTLKALAGALTPAGAIDVLLSRTLTGALTPTGSVDVLISRTLTGTVTSSGALDAVATKALAGAIVPTGALDQLTLKALTAALTPTGALDALVNKTLQGAVVPTGAISKLTLRSLAGAVTPTGTIANTQTVSRSFDGTITPTGALTKLISRTLGASLGSSGALDELVSKTLSGANAPAGQLTKLLSRQLSGSLTPSGVVVKLISRSLTGAVTPTGSLDVAVLEQLTGSITPTGAVSKLTSRTLSSSNTPSGALDIDRFKYLTGSITPTGTVTRLISRTLSGSVATTGSIDVLISRTLAGAAAPTGAISKLISRTLTSAVTPSGSVSTIQTVSRTFTGTVTSAGSIDVVVNKALTSSVGSSSTVTKLTSKTLAGAVVPGPSALSRLISRNLASNVASSGSVSTISTVSRTFDGSISAGGQLDVLVLKSLSGALSSSASCSKLTSHQLFATVGPSGSIAKVLVRTLAGSVSLAGAVSSTVFRTLQLSGNLGPSAALTKVLVRTLPSTAVLAGAVAKSVNKQVAGVATASGVVTPVEPDAIEGSLIPTGSIDTLISRTVSGSLTPTGALTKITARSLSGSQALSGTVAAATVATAALSGSVASQGALTRLVSKVVVGAILPTGTLSRHNDRAFAGFCLTHGDAAHRTSISSSSSLSLAGQLATVFAPGGPQGDSPYGDGHEAHERRRGVSTSDRRARVRARQRR